MLINLLWCFPCDLPCFRILEAEAPVRSEFLSLLRISEFFGFQWQKLAEILSLFKLYNNLGKVAVRVKLWLIIYCGHLVEWIVK